MAAHKELIDGSFLQKASKCYSMAEENDSVMENAGLLITIKRESREGHKTYLPIDSTSQFVMAFKRVDHYVIFR